MFQEVTSVTFGIDTPELCQKVCQVCHAGCNCSGNWSDGNALKGKVEMCEE